MTHDNDSHSDLFDQSARLIGPDKALRYVIERSCIRSKQRVTLTDARGLRLDQDIAANQDFPAFPRSMMDGYAVRLEDAGRTVPAVGEIAAGPLDTRPRLLPGTCWEIMTGGVCPVGTEAVVPNELAHREGNHVAFPDGLTMGLNVADAGSECPAGSVVLHRGDTVTPLAVAVMASLGLDAVDVIPRPVAAVITTGAELVASDALPGLGQIRDSNGPMLLTLLADLGLRDVVHRRALDRREDILAALERSAHVDILLLSGGVSVGNYDLVPECLRMYGAEVVFHKVTQKPGKPLLLAVKDNQLLFGLPGNPLACHLCCHRYVGAAIRAMQGKPAAPDVFEGILTSAIRPKRERTWFTPATATRGEPTWQLEPVSSISSADIFSPSQANCYVELPPGEEPIGCGERVRFYWIGNAPWSC